MQSMRAAVLIAMVLFFSQTYGQGDANLILGKWLKNSKKDLIIEVYRSGDEYKGKITWSKDTDSTKLKGFQILEGLKYDADEQSWEGGKIHHPKSSATYSATARIKSDGTLEVLAYKGLKFIGRKKYFSRLK